MVNKQIELHPGAPIYTNDDEPTMTRRTFNKKVGAATLLVAGVAGAAGITKIMTSRENITASVENTNSNGEATTRAVSLIQSRANIDALTQNPALFAGDLDPNIDKDAEYEELKDLGGVVATMENQKNTTLFANDFLDTVELIIRARGTKQGLLDDIDEGHPIGVRSETGTLIGPMTENYESFADRTNREVGVPMLEGIGPDYFNGANITPTKNVILNQQHYNAEQFEAHAVRQKAIGVGEATLDYTTTLKYQDVIELPLYESGFRNLEQLTDPKRVRINFQTRRGTPEDYEAIDSTTTIVYSKESGTDKFQILFENYYPDKEDLES